MNLRFLRRSSSRMDIEKRMEDAGIPPRAALEANEVAGVAPFPYPLRSEREREGKKDRVEENRHTEAEKRIKDTKGESTGSSSSPELTPTSDTGTPSDSNSAFRVVLYQPNR